MRAAGRFLVYPALAAAVPVAFALDDPARDWVLCNESPVLNRFAHAVGLYCDWPPLMFLGLVLLALALLARSARWRRVVLAMIVAAALSGLVAGAIRFSSGRTRPRADAPQGFYGLRHEGRWLIRDSDFHSFPSGHTATAAGFVFPLLLAAPTVGVPALALPAVVGFARVTSGAHHPSDLALSILIAAMMADLTWRRLRPRNAAAARHSL